MKNIITISFFVISLLSLNISWGQSFSIATNQWAPYINEKNQPLGTAADLLRQILVQEKHYIDWQYQNYDLAFELVSKGKQQSAFPYFKTDEREKQVLYSLPVFSVVSHVYYNRQRENQLDLSQLTRHKFGRVAGYSYGQVMDKYLGKAIIFKTEKDALESLLNNDIDFLPMAESVMNTMLNNSYHDQALLIKKLSALSEKDSLHLIAPMTKEGQALIKVVNQLLVQAKNIESLQPDPVERYKPKDIARLITAEGYPAIVGQASLSNSTEYFTLPQGTRVLVLQWSDKILEPSASDRLYKSMIDLSHVVVLNGPHVGKELYIKNMHLEIQ